MKWLNRFGTNRKKQDALTEDKLMLIKEVRKAHMEWTVAQKNFDYALEKDQIDYAIYALEAAEKRYEMLLREAKQNNVSKLDDIKGKILEG